MRRILTLFVLLCLAVPANGAGDALRIMAFGDSLSSGYELRAGEGFAPVLERRLREEGFDVVVKNAAVAGATTADGRARLPYALEWDPDIVILELGANDALRAFRPRVTRENLDSMIGEIRSRGIKVLLAGMYAPPNLGQEYGDEFNSIYPELSEKHGVPLYPFFLDGVVLDPSLKLDDAMHPNAAGIRVIVDRIAPHVVSVIGGS